MSRHPDTGETAPRMASHADRPIADRLSAVGWLFLADLPESSGKTQECLPVAICSILHPSVELPVVRRIDNPRGASTPTEGATESIKVPPSSTYAHYWSTLSNMFGGRYEGLTPYIVFCVLCYLNGAVLFGL